MEVFRMQSMTQAARRRGHLARHECQLCVRAEASSRRTPAQVPGDVAVKVEQHELELIERLVRQDRTAVSSAVKAIAGIGSGGLVRRAVLERVGEAACSAQSEGAISPQRSEQIVRRVRRALEWTEIGIAG
jgi:hypothetical protein